MFGYSNFTCLLPKRVTFSNLRSINTQWGCTRTEGILRIPRIHWVTNALSPRIKRPPGTSVRNEWSCTSPSHFVFTVLTITTFNNVEIRVNYSRSLHCSSYTCRNLKLLTTLFSLPSCLKALNLDQKHFIYDSNMKNA